MPNHVTTIIRIHCPEDRLEEIKAAHWVDGENGPRFCFKTLIPRPEALDITSDHQLTTLAKGGRSILDEYANTPDSIIEIRSRTEERSLTPERAKELEKMRANIKVYGQPTWYEWSIENWGTKWNAYNCSLDGNRLQFDTAWSHPVPIMRELFRRYQDVLFDVQYADEDAGSNLGKYTSPDVQPYQKEQGELVPRLVGIAYKILGRDFEELMRENLEDGDSWMTKDQWHEAHKAYKEHSLP